MADTSVKFFRSNMSSAPTLPNTAGTLIDVLDACLVNGFGSVTLDSLVITDGVATGTYGSGHNFAMTGATGPVILIEGATPAEINGEWRIASVPTSSTFTFAVTGISNQTATGTITAKRAPAGWEKVFSDTGKAVYRSLDVTSTRLYLRVDDTSAGLQAWASVRMFESMTDVDTGTDGSTTLYILKSNYTGNKTWRVYADSAAFWFVGDTFGSIGTTGLGQCFFGDLAYPALPGDTFHCGLAALPSAVTNGASNIANMTTTSAMVLARSYGGVTKNVGAYRRGHYLNLGTVGNGGASYLDTIGVLVKAVECFEGTTAYRGTMPGWYGQVHANLSTWIFNYYEHPEIGTLFGDRMYNDGDYNQFFDISGPWR